MVSRVHLPRAAALALLAAAALLAAGCGDDDSGGATSSPPATSGGVPSTPATDGASAAAITAYVDEMRGLNTRWNAVSRRYNAALAGINTEQADETWTAAADRTQALQPRAEKIASDLEAIDPPPALAEAHQGWVESAQLAATQAGEVATLLRAGALQPLVNYAQTIGNRRQQQTRDLRKRWQIEVAAAANAAGVELPAWVSQVGEGF